MRHHTLAPEHGLKLGLAQTFGDDDLGTSTLRKQLQRRFHQAIAQRLQGFGLNIYHIQSIKWRFVGIGRGQRLELQATRRFTIQRQLDLMRFDHKVYHPGLQHQLPLALVEGCWLGHRR